VFKRETLKQKAMQITTSEQEIINQHQGQFTVKEIYQAIAGDRQQRHSNWEMGIPFSTVMKVADTKGDFQGEIIEKALNNGYVSDKQAWCVGFYFKKIGLAK
jgi:hypothetical protein